jgi:hypothetical protein
LLDILAGEFVGANPLEEYVTRRTTGGAVDEIGVTTRYTDPLKKAAAPNIS